MKETGQSVAPVRTDPRVNQGGYLSLPLSRTVPVVCRTIKAFPGQFRPTERPGQGEQQPAHNTSMS